MTLIVDLGLLVGLAVWWARSWPWSSDSDIQRQVVALVGGGKEREL